MPYVQRDLTRTAIGRYAVKQPGYAEEWLPDDSPELMPSAAQKQSALVARIRQEASDIIRDTILSLGTEYQQARKDADEFFARTPAYSGTAPRSVLDWANAKIPVQTVQWACDDIRATALNWETKELDIRQNRLKYAEQAKAATATSVAPNDLDSILANWTTFKNQTRTALGI